MMSHATLFSTLSQASQHALSQLMQAVLVESKSLDKTSASLLKDLPQPLHAGLVQAAGSLLRVLNRYWYIVFASELPPLPLSASEVQQLVTSLCGSWSEPMTERDQAVQQGDTLAMQLLRDGCPAWLEQQAQSIADWPAIRQSLAQAPRRFIRVNTLKADKNTLSRRLLRDHIAVSDLPNVATALEVTSDSAIFRSQAFRDGWFEQQDAGSQYLAEQLPVAPGMKVIDACAGAGGKSLALAARMQAKGRLLSMDVEEWKLQALKERAKRAGAGNIETRLITSSKTIKRLADSADALLLDVPCSGTGVFKRNPEGKWRHQPQHLEELIRLQADILRRYSKMLKVQGHLLYATCSILPAENQQQIRHFLAEQPQFSLLREEFINPATTGWDGFYYALLSRNS